MKATPAHVDVRFAGERNVAAPLQRKRPPIGPHPGAPRQSLPQVFLTLTALFLHLILKRSRLLPPLLRQSPCSNLQLLLILEYLEMLAQICREEEFPSIPRDKPANTVDDIFAPWAATWINTTPTSPMCAPPLLSATHRCPVCTHRTQTPLQLTPSNPQSFPMLEDKAAIQILH